MVIANFINKQDALVTGLNQYDYGQVLRIQGLNLPTAVEIHFGLEETGGTTVTRIGVTKDGVTDVVIPDSMLENGDTSLDYTIYAFIYLTDDTSGKTVHRIKMQVKARSKPELLNKPEEKKLFQQAIEAVNRSAKEAEGWAHGREDMPERATDNAKYYSDQALGSAEEVKKVEQSVKDMVATVDGIEQQVQDVKEFAGQAKIASENALLSEQEAKKSEEASLQHRTGAETAENNAEMAEQNAKKSEQAVEQAKQLVMQMGQEVLQNKNQVDGKVEEFNKTVKDASDAINTQKTESLTEIETAKTSSVGAVETKGTEQVKMVSDEGAKQVKAVEDKGNEVLQSIPKDFTTQMQSKLDKNQGAENKGKALVVGEDGNVTVGEVQGGDGIPIINTMSGESPLVIPDSAERVNKGFSLIGNMEQLQTTGTQLFDISKISAVNVAVDKDMIIVKVYSSNTGITADQFMEMTGLKPGDKFSISYTFEGAITDSTGGAIFLGASKKLNVMNGGQTGSLKNTVILPSDFGSEYGSLYFFGNKSGANCYIKNFMINKGESVKPYEPYTGGKPSPSPEYPQEIKNVGKWNETTGKYEVDVRVTGNNILNTQIEPDAKGIYQGWKVGDGKKKITLSIIDKGNNKDISGCYFGLSGNGTDQKDGIVRLIESGKITKTKMTSLNPYVTIFPSDETAQRKILERFDIQCEFGEIQTEYQPYKEQTLIITSDRPITKWDKLIEQDGQIGWLYKAVFDSDVRPSRMDLFPNGFNLYKDHLNGVFTYICYNAKKEIGWQTSVCKQFKNVDGSYSLGTLWNYSDQPAMTAMYFNTNISTLEAFTKWMEENPLELVYKSRESEFIPLPQSEQDAIRALSTYYPTTVITVDGGEVNPDIEVSYIADTKNYIDQKIAAIGKTVVETQKALL